MLSESRNELQRIIQQGLISTLFQPIVSSLEQRIIGYEALSRGPSDSPLHSPLTLFATARHCGLLSELEHLCRSTAISRFCQLQLPGMLFLNVSPETLLEPGHSRGATLQLIQRFGLPPARLVIELTEQAPINDMGLLREALLHYREMGLQVALDDLGAGYAGLQLWSELQPDHVKIDRHFIHDIHLDPIKREFVSAMLSMAKASRSNLIAEGIECAEEQEALEQMGIDWVQGYWLAKPHAEPLEQRAQLEDRLKQCLGLQPDVTGIHSLLIETAPVSADCLTLDVLQRFQDQASLNTLAVVDSSNKPVGTVQRNNFTRKLLKPFALELHGRKPISQLMDDQPLVVDIGQSLEQVSRLLTSRARQRLDEDFIILREGLYYGLGRVMDVLRQITELKIREARHANPLTLLPGNIPIQECLARLLRTGHEARLCYLDLDNFKPFNDLYGYAKGDEVLLILARLLRKHCDQRHDFVGHIGGDDFMLVLRSSDWDARLQRINHDFSRDTLPLYRPEHQRDGGFTAADRHGVQRQHALVSLSIGVLHLDAGNNRQDDPASLAEQASALKQQAKNYPGFSVVCGSSHGQSEQYDLAFRAPDQTPCGLQRVTHKSCGYVC